MTNTVAAPADTDLVGAAIGGEIAAMLADREITPAQLAETVGVSPRRMSRLLTGAPWPLPVLLEVCEVLRPGEGIDELKRVVTVGYNAAPITRELRRPRHVTERLQEVEN